MRNVPKTGLYKSALTSKVVSVLVLDVNEVDEDFYLVTFNRNGENSQDGDITDEYTNTEWLSFVKNNNLAYQRSLNKVEAEFSSDAAFF
jgi:hypothetical protein